MEEKKVLILMTSGPKTPWRCATPFYIATLLASNDAYVEVFFNMDGVNLLKKGVAQNLYPKNASCGEKVRSVYEFMKDAKVAGVKFVSCKQALDSANLKEEDLIEELDEVVPASEFAIRALEADKVLIF